MRKCLLFILLFWSSFGYGQMSLHNTNWLIGYHSTPVTFATLPPYSGGIPEPTYDHSISFNSSNINTSLAVSDAQGNLQFYLVYHFTANGTASSNILNKPKIFDKNGNPFPNGIIQSKFMSEYGGFPIAVPYPKQESKYLIFYTSSGGLYYSVIDMTLNNGLGDIDTNQKDILIGNHGSVIGIKTTIVPACEDRIWLVIRSAKENAYYSYLIDSKGVNHEKVVSEVGNFDVKAYRNFNGVFCGLLSASNNGKYIVSGTNEGTEIYDFEKCSGKLKNARVLDTTSSNGVVFSPDDSKLYTNTHHAVHFEPGGVYVGEIYQFDFNQQSFEEIQNSKTIVMRNPIYESITMFGPLRYSGVFGQMKIGLDGKLYVAKNNTILAQGYVCYLLSPPGNHAIPTPPNNNCHYGQYLHAIHKPNELGMNCEPEFDYVYLNDFRNYPPGVWLQQDIKPANFQPIDTMKGVTENVIVCFDDQTTLAIPKDAECPVWDDGSSEEERMITESGMYWLEYYNGCSFQIDSFDVVFVPLPQINSQFYGCPEQIKIEIKASDNFEYSYTLRNDNQKIVSEIGGLGNVQFTELNEGKHFLQIQAMDVCDTTIEVELHAYPRPDLIVFPREEKIFYGDSIQLSVSGAQYYHWSPSGPLDSATLSNPWAKPLEPTWFFVLGINQYGCVDTSGLFIDIDYAMLDFIPNAFSPNGDGLNDVFKIEGLRYQKVVQFKVFNRLGQEVFSTSNVDVGWDGNFQGRACDVGVYYYLVEIANPNGRNEIFRGEVTLVR